jgi:hypothetical protein
MTNRIAPKDLKKKRGEPDKYIIIDVREEMN